jgi:uncharacterized membrane protein YfcA
MNLVQMSGLSSNSEADRLWWWRLGFYLVAVVVLGTLGTGIARQECALFGEVGNHWHFFLIGVFAATVANSTGAGGGIVFLPVFTLLGLSVTESLATSLAIQCFGMTAGGLSWLQHLKKRAIVDAQSKSLRMILLVGVCGALLGLRGAQELLPNPNWNIEFLFSSFSLVVGLLIFVRTLTGRDVNGGREEEIRPVELVGLGVSGILGGAITAWLSIGVGEILAIYLLVLRFRVDLAVAVAVCVTSITVISGVPFYFGKSVIILEVLVFAAPGALIGGTLAKHLAIYLGAKRLKLGMAAWIILTAIVYLIV